MKNHYLITNLLQVGDTLIFLNPKKKNLKKPLKIVANDKVEFVTLEDGTKISSDDYFEQEKEPLIVPPDEQVPALVKSTIADLKARHPKLRLIAVRNLSLGFSIVDPKTGNDLNLQRTQVSYVRLNFEANGCFSTEDGLEESHDDLRLNGRIIEPNQIPTEDTI